MTDTPTDMPTLAGHYRATFAAGCFWGVETRFRALAGVADVRVGYTGGHTENPTYEAVCSGRTGHAEAVEVLYDPSVLAYAELVRAFFAMHDPTQVDRQGPDRGTQYRSAIFTHDATQHAEAAEAMETERARRGSLATALASAGKFWLAEAYHQRYEEKARPAWVRRLFSIGGSQT